MAADQSKRRFATIDEEGQQAIVEQKDAANTKKATESAVKLLRKYLVEKNLSSDFESMRNDELDNLLSKFFAEVRQENGEIYQKSSLQSIRHGINRHLSTHSSCKDIINGDEFKESQKMFTAVCKDLKRQGKGGIKHFPPIDREDLLKLYEYFDINDSVKLQEMIFVNIMLFFGRRGRENIRDLKISDFGMTTDGDGNRLIYLAKDELTKNHQNDENSAQGRMYATSDDEKCPVKSFVLYKRRLNPNCSFLFQRPSRNQLDITWYDNIPVGHNTLGNMMSRISEKAGLSQRYTNHSLRATASFS